MDPWISPPRADDNDSDISSQEYDEAARYNVIQRTDQSCYKCRATGWHWMFMTAATLNTSRRQTRQHDFEYAIWVCEKCWERDEKTAIGYKTILARPAPQN